jgi:hypothetical protein
MKYTTKIPPNVVTPDRTETRLGTLQFVDGVPTEETARKVSDHMDFSRAVEAMIMTVPAASLQGYHRDNGSVQNRTGGGGDPTGADLRRGQRCLDAGMAMSQAISFNKTKNMFPTSFYGKDSGWEDAMAGMNPKIDLPTYSEFNERASYGFEATTTSAGMVSQVPGKGSAYLGSYYDADGDALMGGNNYKLRIEPNPPAADFWSITVYDIENRLIIRNEIKRSDRSSRTEGLIKNGDGSVDLYFGPKAPEGKEVN